MYKLTIELVPEGCWNVNLRTAFPQLWDCIRRDAYARAKGRCMICGVETRRLEAHEQWSYDEGRAVQKLETVVALCHACHEVKHIAFAQMRGRGADVMEHFMRVNGCSQMEYHAVLSAANEEHRRRNRIDCWQTDLSWLKKNYNL